MTAKETFFCFRIDLIHPETVVEVDWFGSECARSCLIFGGNESLETEVVDANRRKIITYVYVVNFFRYNVCDGPLLPLYNGFQES